MHSPIGKAGFLLGLIVAAVVLMTAPPEGLTEDAWIVVALTALMAIWWATEAIPIPVTALLPIVFLPLSGVTSLSAATSPYADPVVYLFLGGFILATAIEKWGLHRRIALGVVVTIGKDSHLLILAFMVATALISMWISNTAVTLMMAPIAIGVANSVDQKEGATPIAIPLLLGVAYAASIGGLMTPIGSPPNLVALGFLRQQYGLDISFGAWFAMAFPVGVLLLVMTWYLLTRRIFTVDKTLAVEAAVRLRQEYESAGPLTTPELRVIIVFSTVACAWIFRPLLVEIPGLAHLSDPGIAIAGAIALFLLPAGKNHNGVRLLDWQSAQKLPWGVILLFGGGLSLAAAISATGLAAWIGANLTIGAGSLALLLISVVVLAALMTELTSNTATMATLAPVLGAVAVAAGYDPRLIILPAALAVNCAFMLPVATPPNAIVFSSGHLTVPHMVRAGIRLNVVAIVVISAVACLVGPTLAGAGQPSGSTINSLDLSPDGTRLAVTSRAGFCCVLDLDSAGENPFAIGDGAKQEQWRWLFWKGEERPLRC